MILYVGGKAQGKLELALKENEIKSVFDGEKDNLEDISSYECIDKLHIVIKRLLENGKDPMDILSSINAKVVICDEVSCGIVPVEQKDSIYRESVGRCCCSLAKVADKVVRVICGIGVVIK